MHVGPNAGEHGAPNLVRASVEQRPALLACAPIRIWLTLLLALSIVGLVAAMSDLAAVSDNLERASLMWLFSLSAVGLAFLSFAAGAASARPIPNYETAGSDAGPRPTATAQDSPAAAPANDDFTAFFEVDAPETHDALNATTPVARSLAAARTPDAPVARRSGPRWLAWLDDLLTRPLSRGTIVLTIAGTSGLAGFAAWHWRGNVGEAVSVLVAVAILSGLFSRISTMAAQNREVAEASGEASPVSACAESGLLHRPARHRDRRNHQG
jgi:hypothetical protein